MEQSICGVSCAKCNMNYLCKGCAATGGKPFGKECVSAECIGRGGDLCEYRTKLMAEFNALGIEGMPEVVNLYALKGSFINIEYTLPNGEKAKFWDDDRIYLGCQLEKEGSDAEGRCFGIAADDDYLMVSEYGENGADPVLVCLKKRC